MGRGVRAVRLVGCGLVPPRVKSGVQATAMMEKSLELALGESGFSLRQLDGLVAIPTLSEPRFMEAHYLATRIGLLPRKDVVVRTLDTGGAGPVSGA